MCGVVALVVGDDTAVKAATMTEALVHRGPDGEGIWSDVNQRISLGHRRLSIIDIQGGRQPMTSQSGRWVVAFNGEIYNFADLREREFSDYDFCTRSDTEIILAGLDLQGLNSLPLLNGMFSLVAYDRVEERLYFCRDRWGIKPLYFKLTDGALLVASEIKAILSVKPCVEVASQAIYEYLKLSFVLPPVTLFSGISKCQPGVIYQYEVKNRQLAKQCFVSPMAPIRRHLSQEKATETLLTLFRGSVERQLISDVPVGILLSGGVDSAAVAKVAADCSGEVDTFCVGYEGIEEANEFSEAEVTAKEIGTRHHNIIVSEEDAIDVFPSLIRHLEEPVVTTSTFTYFLLCHAVSQRRKVVLTGQGADEPWAGYDRHRLGAARHLLRPIRKALPWRLLFTLVGQERGRKILKALAPAPLPEELISYHALFSQSDLEELLGGRKAAVAANLAEKVEAISAFFPENATFFEKQLSFDVRTSLTENLLMLGDKLSMANSLEVRVPFLDNQYLAFVESLPGAFKRPFPYSSGKYLHKEMCRQLLPRQIVERKKKGFETPLKHWIKGRVGDHILALISESNSFTREFLSLAKIDEMVVDHRSGKANLEKKIFAIWALEEWSRAFR